MKIIKVSFIKKLGIYGITIYPFIFIATDQKGIWLHEECHYFQQERWYKRAFLFGLLLWFFLYLFCLPVFWNYFRRKWEIEAYEFQGLKEQDYSSVLKSWKYGWLQ